VRDVLDEGDETMVKVIDIDAQGRVRLSRRAVLRESGSGEGREEPVRVGEKDDDGRRPRRGRGRPDSSRERKPE
jgi:predicted RNA-binding protein with RPS1 domain